MSKDIETIKEVLTQFAVATHEVKPGQDETPNFEQALQSIQKIIERDVIKAGIDYSMSKLGYSKEMMEAEERLRDIQAKALTKALYREKK